MIRLSQIEKEFISEGVDENVRADGRSRMDYRHFEVQTDLIAHANGSARLKLGGNTDILVAINLEIEEPHADNPNDGRICCSVKCTTSATAEWEGNAAESMNVELSTQLQQILSSGAISTQDLCIIPGAQCWVLYIDALVLNSEGSLLDAASLATYVALHSTTIPDIKVVQGDGAGDLEIEVNDDPFKSTPFPTENLPICVSLIKVGNHYIVDACLEEEACMAARITVGVNKKGSICGITKIGVGGISQIALLEMMEIAARKGVELIGKLESSVSGQKDGESERHSVIVPENMALPNTGS